MPATATPDQIEAIERATLEALRPAHVHAMAHWLLPFDPAEVGRARSAVPLRHEGLDLVALPALCAHYQQNGWPVVLRRPASKPMRLSCPTSQLAVAMQSLWWAGSVPTLGNRNSANRRSRLSGNC